MAENETIRKDFHQRGNGQHADDLSSIVSLVDQLFSSKTPYESGDIRDNRLHGHYQLPDAYAGRKIVLNETITGLVVENEWLTSAEDGLPVIETDEQTVVWNETRFGNELMERVPEEGVSRILKSQKSSDSATVQRHAKGIEVEHGYMNTPAGVEHYSRQLLQLIVTARMTINHAILVHLFEVGKQSYDFQEQRDLKHQYPDRYIEQNVQRFAMFQKSDEGARTIMDRHQTVLKSNGVVATTFILPQGSETFMRGGADDFSKSFNTAGPGGPLALNTPRDNVKTYSNVRIRHSSTLTSFDKREMGEYVRDPAISTVMFGSRQIMQSPYRYVSGTSGYLPWHRDIIIHCGQNDRMQRIGFLEALEASRIGRYEAILRGTSSGGTSDGGGSVNTATPLVNARRPSSKVASLGVREFGNKIAIGAKTLYNRFSGNTTLQEIGHTLFKESFNVLPQLEDGLLVLYPDLQSMIKKVGSNADDAALLAKLQTHQTTKGPSKKRWSKLMMLYLLNHKKSALGELIAFHFSINENVEGLSEYLIEVNGVFTKALHDGTDVKASQLINAGLNSASPLVQPVLDTLESGEAYDQFKRTVTSPHLSPSQVSGIVDCCKGFNVTTAKKTAAMAKGIASLVHEKIGAAHHEELNAKIVQVDVGDVMGDVGVGAIGIGANPEEGGFLEKAKTEDIDVTLLLFRPFQSWKTSSAILAKMGSETGGLLLGKSTTMIGDNAQKMVHYTNYALYFTPFIRKPENISIMHSVMVREYRGGRNTQFITKPDIEGWRRNCWIMDANPNRNSILVIPVPGDFKDDVLNLRLDRNPYPNPSGNLQTQVNQCFEKARELWSIDEMVTESEEVEFGSTINMLCRPDHQQEYVVSKKEFEGFRIGRSHLGPNIYAGMMGVLEGNERCLKQMDYAKTKLIVG